MVTYINPLDFETIFLGYFLGGTKLFAYIFIIIVSYACARYQIDNKYYLTILAIGSIMFGIYFGESMFVVVLLILGIITFKPLASLFSK